MWGDSKGLVCSFWFLSFIEYSWFTVQLVSAVQQRGSVTHIHTPLFFFFTFFSFISTKNIVYWGVAINNIMIVSGEPRRDSAIDIYMYPFSPSRLAHNIEFHVLYSGSLLVIHLHIAVHTPLFKMLFPCRLLQSIELSSLSYMVGSYLLPVLYIVMCILLHMQSRDMEVHIYILLLFSPSVLSSSLRLHELQHARLLCPSLSPWVCSNSSVESVMPSNHFILFPSSLLLPSIFPSIRVISSEAAFRIRWPKYWSFRISPSYEYSGLISFRIDWFDLLAVQGTLKTLLRRQSSKASVHQCSTFSSVHLISLVWLFATLLADYSTPGFPVHH